MRMGLTPEEIARRAFTPSVDGYHQGEVRSFLERIAVQLRAMQSGFPEGRVEIAELTTAIQDREPRLIELQDQLQNTIAELTAAATLMKQAQTETTHQLATAQQITADRSPTAVVAGGQRFSAGEDTAEQHGLPTRPTNEQQRLDEQLIDAQKLTAEQRALAEQLAAVGQQQSEQLEIARQLVAEQREASEYLATAGQQQSDQLDTAQRMTAEQRDAAEHLAIAGQQQAAQIEAAQQLTARQTKAADQLASATELTAQRLAEVTGAAAAIAAAPPVAASPATPAAQPSTERSYRAEQSDSANASPSSQTQPEATAVRATTSDKASSSASTSAPAPDNTMSLFASDLDDQPLFSDSANDLLDGVLDDVMGNLEGDES